MWKKTNKFDNLMVYIYQETTEKPLTSDKSHQKQIYEGGRERGQKIPRSYPFFLSFLLLETTK